MNHAVNQEDFRIRLLIVDDEQSIRKLCMTVGETLGFVCLEAESGESALALLEEQSVHMILSDWSCLTCRASNFSHSRKPFTRASKSPS